MKFRTGLLVSAAALLFSLGGAYTAWSEMTVPAAPPAAPAPPAGEPLSAEMRQKHYAELERQGQLKYLSGPKTQGQPVQIAGKKIPLPQDAYVRNYVMNINCMPGGPCPDEFPFLIIARGQSQIWVGAKSGRLFYEKTAPGQEQAFDFLKGGLR